MTTLGEIMTRNVAVAGPSVSMESVWKTMVQRKVSRVVIVSGASTPVGMITNKDLLRYTLMEDSKDLSEVNVYQVMSKPVLREPESTSVSSCAKRMLEAAVSSMVVVRGENLVGIVTKTDLCMFYAVNGGTTEAVRDLMTPNPITVRSAQRVLDAAIIMAEYNISRIPVVDDTLDGIITLSDLTAINPALNPRIVMAKSKILNVRGRIVAPGEARLIRVGDAMSGEPMTIPEGASLSDAAKSMITRRIGGLPVLDAKGGLCGIVTKTDVLKAVSRMRQP